MGTLSCVEWLGWNWSVVEALVVLQCPPTHSVIPAKAGIQYAAAYRSIAGASGILDHSARSRMMTGDDTASRSRGSICPRLAIEFPYPPVRGRRECRVHAAPAVSCAIVYNKGAHEHTGQRRHPTFPAQWLYGLYRALPGRAGLVVTVAGGIASTNLTPASGRQDHTTSPYAYVTGNPWRILVGKNSLPYPTPKCI